jgi:hypothetical protein
VKNELHYAINQEQRILADMPATVYNSFRRIVLAAMGLFLWMSSPMARLEAFAKPLRKKKL